VRGSGPSPSHGEHELAAAFISGWRQSKTTAPD
jgi:hypothetical protein